MPLPLFRSAAMLFIGMMGLPASAQQLQEETSGPGTVGLWQEGLEAPLRATPPDRRLEAGTLLGGVMVFEADHGFARYLKCGRERDAFEKHGITALRGT